MAIWNNVFEKALEGAQVAIPSVVKAAAENPCTKPMMPYVIPNAAARAFVYNAAGVDRMTNKDFRPDELKQAEHAWHAAQGGRQTKPVSVKPDHYQGDVAKTTGNMNPVKNVVENPMRMTLGSMHVAPNGQVLHALNGNYYSGDVYDFNPEVQRNPEYSTYYQALQDFATRVRGVKPPMIIDVNLKGQQ